MFFGNFKEFNLSLFILIFLEYLFYLEIFIEVLSYVLGM